MIGKLVMMVFLGIGCVAVGERAAAQQQPGGEPALLAIVHTTVIGGTGAPAESDQTVLIRGDRISAVGKSGRIKVSRRARVIDGRGKYVLPGLWDAHVHLYLTGPSALPLFVANGVTSGRDMGGDFTKQRAWRIQIAAGTLLGPRIRTSGPVLESKRFLEILPKADQALGLHLSEETLPTRIGVSTPEEAKAAVDHLADMGVDFVKFRTVASRDVFLAIAQEAKKRGLAFTGHEPEIVLPAEASNAGQRSIEHLPFMSLLKASEETRNLTYRTFLQNGTWIDPTLVAMLGYRGTPDDRIMAVIQDKPNRLDPRRKYLSPMLLESWREQVLIKQLEEPNDWPALSRRGYADLFEMHRAGVRLVAGTDTGAPLVYPGFSLLEELALLVEKGGLTPREAIGAATIEPARMVGLDKELGTVEPGKLADLLVLDQDPLQDIRNIRQIFAVVASGRVMDRKALDGILEAVAATAAKESETSAQPR